MEAELLCTTKNIVYVKAAAKKKNKNIPITTSSTRDFKQQICRTPQENFNERRKGGQRWRKYGGSNKQKRQQKPKQQQWQNQQQSALLTSSCRTVGCTVGN